MKTPSSLLSKLIAAVASLALLWLAFSVYASGEPLWAVALLAFGGTSLYIYLSATTLAWRYLFPGVAAMLIFVAFPLVYTIQIGFTNYSSNNLLTESRARAYLLEQADVNEARAFATTVHAVGSEYRLVLAGQGEGAVSTRYMSSVFKDAAPTAPLGMQPLPTDQVLGDALNLRQVIALRDTLMALKLTMPDKTTLQYAGLHEFAVFEPLWQEQAGGGLKRLADGALYQPNRDTGFFEDAKGQRLQPGFKVNVGLANYTRMFGDADMRGPFLSIFIWTVVFAGLTVVFSTAIGMTLAVVLNWEALKYRTLYRTLLFLPYAVPGFISILVFKGLFNQNFGEINAILDAVFGVRPNWFADPTLAKAMILIVNTWLGYPYIMVLCTGLIKSIPSDLYEASAIAGAKPLTNFFRITAPLIVKPLTPLLISAFAFNFNNFVLISLLTDGRPDILNTKLPAGTTDILVSYTYRIAFTDAGANFGLAAAISTVIFFLVAILSMANLKLTQSNDARKG
ncbi:MAG: maltose ABC transporter permease MalF [Burkholderiales bacterium PBB3]|nr:MAG: maltose ABC transporter permease MalF [Burkholderiales bacterium PBB3]